MTQLAPRRPTPTFAQVLVRSFLNGLLVIVPVAATAWILWRLFRLVDGFLPLPDTVAPGIGFLTVVLVVMLIGLLARMFVAAQLLRLSDRILGHLPFVKLVYTAIKDLTQAFVGEERKFDRPVLLSLGDGLDVEVVGFVTREDLSDLGISDRVAVYVPQSYNFAANLLIVPPTRVRPIDRPAGEVMTFVVSGGVTSVEA